mmetsp:Transcript_21820/g.39782  ORF Transcript_21820/g.39782 Transcript_21820/m.39782 type:complete len:172 (-) Transcript_21820:1387-1902(-)
MVRLAKIGKGSASHREEGEEFHSSFYSSHPELAPEQDEQFFRADQYIAKHSISELFNTLLTSLLLEFPDSPKAHILDQIKKMLYYREKSDMQQPKLFTNEEFELMFETYDLGQDGYVPYFALLQALEAIGVRSPVDVLAQDFPELNIESKVSRPKFVQVLMTEFSKRGYSY